MPWNILEKLWERTTKTSNISIVDDNHTWNQEIKTLYKLGISMEDTLEFLYFENLILKFLKLGSRIDRETKILKIKM